MHVIGIDVGSQSVKALLSDESGAVLATASAPCAMAHPRDGWAEQDPADWEHAIAHAVRGACEQAGVRGEEVRMLGLACQVDGLVALGEDLRPLRPAIIWLDRRATRQTDALAAAAGAETLTARTGLQPDSSHTAPKAMWLRDEEPEHFGAARWLAPVGGHLNGWLTGEVVQDHANASSTLVYDVHRRAWDESLVGHAGLDIATLPPIRPSHDVIGRLRTEAADLLGLSTACEVVVGTGDEHAAAVGAGALGPGIVVDVTGTAEPVAVPADTAVIDDEGLVETHAHAVDGVLLVENPGFVSGGSTRWLAQALRVEQAEVFALAASAPAGSAGVLFVPALSGSMAPRWNDGMRGAFAGLAMNHEGEHLARAVLEGCTFALRDIVDRFAALGLAGEEIRVVGGGARSALWLQIKADVTGSPVRPVEGDAATSAGAAMLAGVAVGNFVDLAEAAAATVRLAPEPVLPDPANAEVYADAYGRYRRLFDATESALA
jgi:xylulokinase